MLDVGDRVAGFEIDALVARGGMAVVYRAREIALGRTVALKVIAPELAEDPTFRQRFTQESRLAASIDHPNIIPIYAAGEADGLLYLVMRYVDGDTLAAVFTERGPLDADVAVPLFVQVAGALDTAHAHHLVHRDVKPRNILLAPGPDLAQRHVYLTDFGLTKRVSGDSTITTAGQFLGTIRYVAPEQISSGPISSRADVYSLACVIVEGLTGQPPFVRDDEAAVLWSHMSEDPPSVTNRRADLPLAVDEVLRRALAKDPADRQSTCGELVDDLAVALKPVPSSIADTVVLSALPLDEAEPDDATDPPTIESPAVAALTSSRTTPTVPAAAVSGPADSEPAVAPPTAPAPPPRRKRRLLPALIVGLVVLGVAAAVVLFVLPGQRPAATSAAEATSASPPPALPQSAAPLPEDTLVLRRQDRGRWTIRTVTLDGDAGPVLLTGRQNRFVQLTPDRRTVLYLRESNDRTTLRAMSADGKRDRTLFTDGTPACPRMARPTVRADGVLALFCVEVTGGRGTLNIMSPAGTLLGVLDRGRIGGPTFTPDGRSIVYWRAEYEGATGGALFRVPADGSGTPEELVDADNGELSDPTVSPTGEQVAASRTQGDEQQIVVVDLTEGEATVEGLTEGFVDSGPSWSPDTSQIMFRRGTDDASDLYVIKADGSDPRRVFRSDGYASQPVWTAQ